MEGRALASLLPDVTQRRPEVMRIVKNSLEREDNFFMFCCYFF